MPKFQRKYILTIFPSYKLTDGNLVPSAEQPIVIQDPLTIELGIRRLLLSSCNTAHFKIFNLGPDKRNSIVKSRIDYAHFRQVTLQAGYDYPLPIVFTGNIKEARSFREEGSVNWITQIDAYDFGFAVQNCFSNWTVQNTTKNDVVNRLIDDLKKGFVQRGAISQYSEPIDKRSVCGPTWQALQDETNGKCFIDNGRVNVLQDDEAFEGSVPVLDSSTGLLATPKLDGTFLTVDMLFEPGLLLGQMIKLNSSSPLSVYGQSLNGTYRVNGLEHHGVISEAVGGKCKTTAVLFAGGKIFNIIAGGPS